MASGSGFVGQGSRLSVRVSLAHPANIDDGRGEEEDIHLAHTSFSDPRKRQGWSLSSHGILSWQLQWLSFVRSHSSFRTEMFSKEFH